MNKITRNKIKMLIREELNKLVELSTKFEVDKVRKLVDRDKFLNYEWKKIKMHREEQNHKRLLKIEQDWAKVCEEMDLDFTVECDKNLTVIENCIKKITDEISTY